MLGRHLALFLYNYYWDNYFRALFAEKGVSPISL
jgi:hypothetical protein